MTGLSTASASIESRAADGSGPPRRVDLRTGIAAATAAVVLGFVLLHGPSRPARGGDDDPSAHRAAPGVASIGEIRRTLKADDVRLIALANAILEEPGASGGFEDQLDRLRIDAIRAEGDHQYAALQREIAEMALKEYTEAILPRDMTAVEGELSIAQAAVVQARNKAQDANDDLQKITRQLEEQKAVFTLQQAEIKKKILLEFTRSQHTRELESRLARARSDERSKKAEWELVKGRVGKAQEAAAAGRLHTEAEKRILALLDAAIPVEEQAHVKLRQCAKEPEPGVEAEVRDLTNRLGSILDEAEAVKSADDLSRLKPRLQKVARPYSATRSR